jgi:hypothetical protein
MTAQAQERGAALEAPAFDLTPMRVARLALFATFVWFLAALFIRYAGPHGVLVGAKAALLYALTIVFTIPLNARARKIAGLPKTHMVPVIAVTTATATMLDGIAMTYFPTLYGPDPVIMGEGAAWLLWAIGVATALSLAVAAGERRAA